MFPLNESPDSGCPGVGRADAGQLPADPGWAVSPYLEGCNPVCPPQQRGAAHKHRPIDRWFQKDVSLSSTTTGPWYVSHARGSPPPEPTKKTKLLVLRHEARGRVGSWNGQLGVPGGWEHSRLSTSPRPSLHYDPSMREKSLPTMLISSQAITGFSVYPQKSSFILRFAHFQTVSEDMGTVKFP